MIIRNTVTLLYFFLYLYCFSAGTGAGFQYGGWRLIPPSAFVSMHAADGTAVLQYFVPFYVFSVPIAVAAIWLHHPALSQAWIAVATVLHLVTFVATVALIIPLQNQLQEGYSLATINRIIALHLYLRVIPGLIGVAILAMLFFQILRTTSSTLPIR